MAFNSEAFSTLPASCASQLIVLIAVRRYALHYFKSLLSFNYFAVLVLQGDGVAM